MIICKDRAILLFLLLIIYLDETRAEQNWKTSETAILCPPLPQIQHGSIFQDTSDGLANNYDSVAEYTCEFGYILNGDAQIRIVERTCQSDGTWSGYEPTCEDSCDTQPEVIASISALDWRPWCTRSSCTQRLAATPCPTFSRTQHGSLFQDTYKDRFANNYENIAANTYDKGMCVKQVEREIVLLAKSGKRPVFELLHYACNLNKANYAVRVRIYNVSNDFDANVKLARGTAMASLNQGQERLTQGDDMRFFSKFQELEEGKTYIIIGKDGHRTFDDRHSLLYPIMGTTLVMEYISP